LLCPPPRKITAGVKRVMMDLSFASSAAEEGNAISRIC